MESDFWEVVDWKETQLAEEYATLGRELERWQAGFVGERDVARARSEMQAIQKAEDLNP